MTVDVYFKNGHQARIVEGVKVEPGRFPQIEGTTSLGQLAIVVKDDKGQEIGHFLTNELVGYDISE